LIIGLLQGGLEREIMEIFCRHGRDEKSWKNLVGNLAWKGGIGVGGWFVQVMVSVLSTVRVLQFPKPRV
jgi:hypothetical protein